MEVNKSQIIADMINSFEQSYLEFLEASQLDNRPVIRAGFFVACEKVVRDSPNPDDDIQKAVLKFVCTSQHVALRDFLEVVEMTFMDVSLRKLRQDAAREYLRKTG